jgi:hypothetical protein
LFFHRWSHLVVARIFHDDIRKDDDIETQWPAASPPMPSWAYGNAKVECRRQERDATDTVMQRSRNMAASPPK